MAGRPKKRDSLCMGRWQEMGGRQSRVPPFTPGADGGSPKSGYGVHCKVRRLLEFIPNTCIFKPKSVHVRSAVLNGRDFAPRRHL